MTSAQFKAALLAIARAQLALRPWSDADDARALLRAELAARGLNADEADEFLRREEKRAVELLAATRDAAREGKFTTLKTAGYEA